MIKLINNIKLLSWNKLRMLRQFMNLVKNIGTKRPNTSLGRWEHRISDKHRDTKAIWANADHCGDVICGKPKDIVKNIEQIKTNK